MELQALIERLRVAFGEPALQVSEPWRPFNGNQREIRVLRRPPLGRGQFGIVFATIIRVAPNRYLPAAMKMAALLDDHVAEVLNGLAVNELLDAGVTPGLCYMLDAFAHSTLKPGSVRTPPDWDECLWTHIDQFVFTVRDDVRRLYGVHAIHKEQVNREQPRASTARVSGGYTFGFVFTELVFTSPVRSPATARELLSELYVQFDAIRGLGAVGMHHCDISNRNCLVGHHLMPQRQGMRCLLRSDESEAIRVKLYGPTLLRFGVDYDQPLAMAHVSNSFEQAREGPSYMASYTSITTDRTPVLIDYGKMRRVDFPAGQDIEQTRKEIARRLEAKQEDIPRFVISATSPPAYDYMGAYRGQAEAIGSALPSLSFPSYPTTTETTRGPEQINPFVVPSSPTRPFLVVHSELTEVFSMATVAIERILGYAPFGGYYLVADKESSKLRPGQAALPLEVSTKKRKSVLKLGTFHPEYMAQRLDEVAPDGYHWAIFTNVELHGRLRQYVRAKLALPQFAQARCPWLGYTKRSLDAPNEPSDPRMLERSTFTVMQRLHALGVPSAQEVEGTFFADFFEELRREGHNEQSGWLRTVVEHTLRTRFQLSPLHTSDMLECLTLCLSWDAAKRPPARRVLRNAAFGILNVPLLPGDGERRLWSAEVPTPVVWPSRPRVDGSGKLVLWAASEVPCTYSYVAPDGGLTPPSIRCQAGCRPVAAVLELFRQHGRVPGVLLKDHKTQQLLHPGDALNVAVFNFNTGLLDYYDSRPYINFGTRLPDSVTAMGLCAAFANTTSLHAYIETLRLLDDTVIPDWILEPTTEEEEEETGGPPAKRPRLE